MHEKLFFFQKAPVWAGMWDWESLGAGFAICSVTFKIPLGWANLLVLHPVSSGRKVSAWHPYSKRVYFLGTPATALCLPVGWKKIFFLGWQCLYFSSIPEYFSPWDVLPVKMTQELPVCQSNVIFFSLAVSCSCSCRTGSTRAYISHLGILRVKEDEQINYWRTCGTSMFVLLHLEWNHPSCSLDGMWINTGKNSSGVCKRNCCSLNTSRSGEGFSKSWRRRCSWYNSFGFLAKFHPKFFSKDVLENSMGAAWENLVMDSNGLRGK